MTLSCCRPWLALLIGVVSLTGCSSKNGDGHKGADARNGNGVQNSDQAIRLDSELTPLQREAERRARKVFEEYFLCQGNSFYAVYRKFDDPTEVFVQVKEVVGIPYSWMTEADRLNGFEFKGKVGYRFPVFRHYLDSWGEWQNGVHTVSVDMEKRNGTWKTLESEGIPSHIFDGYFYVRKPKPAEIPK